MKKDQLEKEINKTEIRKKDGKKGDDIDDIAWPRMLALYMYHTPLYTAPYGLLLTLPDDMSADCGLYIHRKLPVNIISIAYNSIWNRHFQIAFYCFLNVDAKRSIEDQFLYAIRRNISIHAVLLGCVCRQCLFSCACPFYFHLFLYVCDVDWITWIFEIPAGCNIATTTTPCVCGSPPSPHLVGTSHCVCVHERGLLSIEPK